MRFTPPPPAPCQECGGDPVHHTLEYLATALDSILLPLFSLPAKMAQTFLPRVKKEWSFAPLYYFLERHNVGEFLDEPDDKTLLLDCVLWEEAKKRGIHMREFRPFGLAKNTFVATLPNGNVLDFEGVPLPSNRRTVWWIDDKSVLKKELHKYGIPVAQGGVVTKKHKAVELFGRLSKPVIAKPAVGSASRHTTLHLQNEDALIRAFSVAQEISHGVVIEEELQGAVYRPTLVGGTLIATLRRDKPHVIGDGVHTVAELVAEANKHPARKGPYFSPLTLEAAGGELAYQGLTETSVPDKHQRVQLHQKINWSGGGTTADVTDDVHPDNKELFEKIARILQAPLVGIDFIIQDISRPWHEQQKCGVIECNSMPYFDNHHLPFEGTPRNVATHIWDLVDSKNPRS